MWQAILGAIGAIAVAIFGFLFHKRGDKISELESEIDKSQKQNEIYQSNIELSKPLEEKHVDEDVDKAISDFNSGD